MKVLMFGWEFPPNITGGLGTACHGITKGLLSISEDVDITFVVPKVFGNETKKKFKLLGANEIDLIKSKIHYEKFALPLSYCAVDSGLLPYVDPKAYTAMSEYAVEKIGHQAISNPLAKIKFSGKYGPDLMKEIHNFSVIGEYLATQSTFDVIHAHDWLTYPAGIAAKKKSGKPLLIHVHATDFDRSRGQVNPVVFQIEKEGMEMAEKIITVSEHTRKIVIEKYQIPASKVTTVHNGVEPLSSIEHVNHHEKEPAKTVTFLGRITMQKGPEYFIGLAQYILARMDSVNFVMAGSGDMLEAMKCEVEKAGMTDRFRFPGFLKGDDVFKMLKQSDIYVMPSVSEPFGISPLEAMQCGTPCIISHQSGVSEVVKHAIKTDYWDIEAMADAIHSILTRPALSQMLSSFGKQEVGQLEWKDSARKIYHLYHKVA
ncbi:glycosyltransferase [Mangrovibacterium sp.]|uniref:glycosyltransferase n=1 Tax=Mangrovibacterium sp. TaxID=1961364 RepID=UPI003561CDF6